MCTMQIRTFAALLYIKEIKRISWIPIMINEQVEGVPNLAHPP